jgi:hypothetical protein
VNISPGGDNGMAEHTPRWEGDRIGQGIGDGAWIVPSVRSLLDALSEATWIAEDPADHLLLQLQGAINGAGSPWSMLSADLLDGVYVLALGWSRPEGRMRDLGADIFVLLGSIAENATYVHQRAEGESVIYDIVTGMLLGDSPFAPHGHAVQFRIGGDEVRRIVTGMRSS